MNIHQVDTMAGSIFQSMRQNERENKIEQKDHPSSVTLLALVTAIQGSLL